jgi:gliding motility-associated-like protein
MKKNHIQCFNLPSVSNLKIRILKFAHTILIVCACCMTVFVCSAQPTSWSNHGGNQKRNGLSPVVGPSTFSQLWNNARPGVFGMPGLIEGNRFVTMRFKSLTNAPVECLNLSTGALLWSRDVTGGTGRSLPVGIKNGKVFVVRLLESANDSLFALDAATGNRLWTSPLCVSTYITESANFDNNGNLILTYINKMRCISHVDGSLIWENNFIGLASGSAEMSINPENNTGYTMDQIGGVYYIWAWDLNNGNKKYKHIISNPSGDSQQTCPVYIGKDGTVFVYNSSDNVSAYSDNGIQLTQLWSTDIGTSYPFSYCCVGPDNSFYVPSESRILRFNPLNGALVDSSETIGLTTFNFIRLSADASGKIFASNAENNIYAFSAGLQTLWSDFIPNNNTCGVAIGSNGVMVVSGSGVIKAYSSGCKGLIQASSDTCEGNQVAFSVLGPALQAISWNFDDPGSGAANTSTAQTPVHVFSDSGTFQVQAIATFACGVDTLNYTIRIADCSCTGNIAASVPDSCGETISFSVESDKSLLLVSWNFGNPASGALNSSSEFAPVHRYGASGNYKLRAIALFDCGLDTLEKNLTIRLCEKAPCEIFIPNALTPNGDGVNEGFCPRANCTFEEYELQLYNRWGQQIFQSKNPGEEWMPGVEGQAGVVYFYTIRYRFAGGQTAQEKGTLTLLGKQQ